MHENYVKLYGSKILWTHLVYFMLPGNKLVFNYGWTSVMQHTILEQSWAYLPTLPVFPGVSNLPGNTYHGLFHFFFSLISLFWRYQKRKIKQEVDLALLFELFSIGKCITEHRHWLEINQSNWTIHGRKLGRFSNAVIDIGNIQKAFGWFSENS